MKLHQYNEMMAYLTRREHFADGSPPPKKPYNALQFKKKTDTLLQGVYGTGKSSNAFLVDLMQQELNKAVEEGVVTMEEGLEFIKSRKKYYDDYLLEKSKNTDGPISLPSVEERKELKAGATPGVSNPKGDKYKLTATQLENLKSKILKLNEGLQGISFTLGKTPKGGTTIRLANNARVFRDLTGTSHFSAAPTDEGLQKLIDKSNEIKETDVYKKYITGVKPDGRSKTLDQETLDKRKDQKNIVKKEKYARYKKQDPFNIYDTLKRYKGEKFPGTLSQEIQIQHGQPKFTTQTLSRMGLIPVETNNLPVVKNMERIRNELVTSINKKLKNPNRSIADKKILIEEFNDTMKGLRGQLKGSDAQGLVNFELLDIDEKGNVKKIKDISFNPKKGLAYGSELGELDLSKITKEQADEIIKLGKKKIDIEALKLTTSATTADKIDRPEKAKLSDAFKKFGKYAKIIAKPVVRAVSPFIPIVGTAGTLMGAADVAEASTFTKKPDDLGIAYLAGPEVAKKYGEFKESVRGKSDEFEEFVP